MYLKELEINGFKSFAKKADLLFTTSISGIVGPNGSGKSNVAEAFRFVLGEQSIKNMRGKKGEDLIFTGAAGRAQRGSVKVVFDNKDHTLDIDYDEVSVQRVVHRDGTNDYLINGSPVRAKDIAELLSGANIGASGHHIISQGEADRILSINPKERREMLQEALGLKIYAIRKTDSERKLAKASENLKEVTTELRSITPRITYLKKEVEKVEKAKSMKEELRELYKLFFPKKAEIEKQVALKKQDVAQTNEQLVTIDGQISELQAKLDDVTSETGVEEKTNELIRLEKELQSLRETKAEKEREVGKTDARIEIAEVEKKRHEARESNSDHKEFLEKIAEKMHTFWVKWAKELLQEENISSERKARWEKLFVSYAELPEPEKDTDRTFAKEIIGVIEGTDAAPEEYDESILKNLITQKESLGAEIQKLVEEEKTLEQKRDELDDLRDSKETVTQKVQIDILTIEKERSEVMSQKNMHQTQLERLEQELRVFLTEEAAARELFGVETDAFFAGEVQQDAELNLKDKITRLKVLLEGSNLAVSDSVTEEYEKLVAHKEYIEKEMSDLNETSASLEKLIVELQEQIDAKFRSGLEHINKEFSKFFQTLFSGGKASLFLVDIPLRRESEDDPQEYEIGVDLSVSLPNKKIKGLSMLSGGERSLTSIALLFAMSSVTPPPFIILDETDAALDEANSKRYGDMIELLAKESQLILITHNRETMSRAGILYGVTMGNDGASKLLSVSLEQAEAVAK